MFQALCSCNGIPCMLAHHMIHWIGPCSDYTEVNIKKMGVARTRMVCVPPWSQTRCVCELSKGAQARGILYTESLPLRARSSGYSYFNT